MRVLGDPVVADPLPRQRHGGGEAVGRDDAAEGGRPPAKAVDDGPDIAPLRRLDGVALADEVAERPEGDHVGGEKRPCAGEIDGPDMLGEALEPGADAVEIVLWGRWRHKGAPVAIGARFASVFPPAGR